MAYHGYLPVIKNYIDQFQHAPSILEIGVDTGASFISIATHLLRTKQEFALIGVDVKIQDSVKIIASNLDRSDNQNLYLVEQNSLKVLPDLIEQNIKFDVIMLDGDHNYHTVSNELKHIENVIYDHTLIVIDDYHGRWSEHDMWYSEREGYENVSCATQKISTEKQGVKAAVDDWLQSHPDWNKYKLMPGEPVILTKQKIELSNIDS